MPMYNLIEYNDIYCFNDISVNANPISVGLKSTRQRINTVNFYLPHILTPLVSVVFKHIDQIQEPLICNVILTSYLLCNGFFDCAVHFQDR